MIERLQNSSPSAQFPFVIKGMLTTSEAAERLGVTPGRVRQFVLSGRLPAEKIGRDLFIKESDLKLVEERPTGRPSTKKATKKGKR
jgi:excisionase family DNA binding protein